MKKLGLVVILSIAFSLPFYSQEQVKTPDIMNTGSLFEQLDYIQKRTNIYNNYRAIREDIFLNLKKNTLDTLSHLNNNLKDLTRQITTMKNEQDSLNSILLKTREDLQYAVKNRDSLKLLGIPMHKILYNTIVWFIIAGLTALLIFMILFFVRNRSLMVQSKKELASVQEEFENYRKTNREKIEKLVIDHFNEIKKLKGEK